MSEPTTASLEKIIVHHGQLFEEVFKRFDKMDQERREDREQHDEERRNDMQEREKERLARVIKRRLGSRVLGRSHSVTLLG